MCITDLLTPVSVIYTIYTSVIIVGTCFTNLLALLISTKRECHLAVGIQPSVIALIYFDFSVMTLGVIIITIISLGVILMIIGIVMITIIIIVLIVMKVR